MKKVDIESEQGFHVRAETDRAEVATMILNPGENTGGPDNRHEKGDQWMFVLSGSGEVTVEGRKQRLNSGELLLIEKGEAHEVRCTGDEAFETLNFYAPKEY